MSIRDGIDRALSTLTGASPVPAPVTRTLANSAILGPSEAPAIGSPFAPDDVLQRIVLGDLFPGLDTAATVPRIDRARAIGIPAVAKSRMIIGTLARLQLVSTDRAGSITPGPTDFQSFLTQPDTSQARFVQLLWTLDDLLFYGVSWWYVRARYATRRPMIAARVIPGGVQLQDGGKVTVYGREVDPADVLRFDGPHEGLLNSAASTLSAAWQIERSMVRYANNPTPATELHQNDQAPMTEDDVKALLAAWRAARANPAMGGVAYTPKNIEVKIHGEPSTDLLIYASNRLAVDIARHAGLPADALDASTEGSSMTYANVMDKARNLIDYGLGNYAEAITARLSMNDVSPLGTLAAFDMAGLTAPSNSNPTDDVPDTPPAPAAPAIGAGA